ncbi:hypothetical protein Tco_0242067, partial [Tanacetum coccineum]
MVQEQWDDTLDHDSNCTDNEEEDEAEEVQAIPVYPKKELIEPLEWKVPGKQVENLDEETPKVGVKATTRSLEYCLPSRRSANSRSWRENRVFLDEEQLLFIAGGQTNTFDDDVDEAAVQDLALNEDNTMFMANLSSADLIFDEAGPSYDSDILYAIQDHDNYLDSV